MILNIVDEFRLSDKKTIKVFKIRKYVFHIKHLRLKTNKDDIQATKSCSKTNSDEITEERIEQMIWSDHAVVREERTRQFLLRVLGSDSF